MQPIAANKEIAIPLTAAEWLVVRRLMGRGPFDDVVPIIGKIEARFSAEQQGSDEPEAS